MEANLVATSLIAVAVSILTTVVTQYFFAPSLEARKQVKLDQAAAMSAVVNHLRQRLNHMDSTVILRDMISGDTDSEQMHRKMAELRGMTATRDLSHDLAAAGYSPRVMRLSTRLELVTELYEMLDNPPDATTASLRTLYSAAIKALDPSTLPGTRWLHFRRTDRYFRTTEVF